MTRVFVCLSSFCFFVGLLFSPVFCNESLATDYYVDAQAADGGDGTADLPFNSLSQVNAIILNAGDNVYFKRGPSQIFSPDPASNVPSLLNIVEVHGEEGKPVVFGTYGTGALPVIDGTGTTKPVWTSDGGNIYSTERTVNGQIIAPNLVVYNGEAIPPLITLKLSSVPTELTANAVLIRKDSYGTFWVKSIDGKNVSGITSVDFVAGEKVSFRYINNDGEEKGWTGADLNVDAVISTGQEAKDALAAYGKSGQWYWDESTDPGKIFLYSTTVPDDNTVQIPWTSEGIRMVNSSYVVIQDLRVQNFNKQGIVLFVCNNVTVERNEISTCGRTGIQMWTDSNNIIQNNKIDSVSGGISLWAPDRFSTLNNQISGNSISNCRGACIGLSSELGLSSGTISGNIISNNTITNANTTGYDGAGIYTFYAGANTISDNTISDCGSIYLRSAGIMVDWGDGAMTITGNTIENNSLAGIAVSGAGHNITGNTLTNNGISTMGVPRSQINFFNGGLDYSTAASRCTVTGNTMYVDEGYHFVTAEAGSCYRHYFADNSYEGSTTRQFFWPCISDEWIDLETWLKNINKASILMFLNGWIHPKI